MNNILGKPSSVKQLLNIHNSIINEFIHNLEKQFENNDEIIINKFDIQLKLLTLESNFFDLKK